MPSILTFRRGTAAQNDAFTGNAGEITVDNTNGTLRVHDGVTAGGSQLATQSYVTTQLNGLGTLSTLDSVGTAQITDGAITNTKLANTSVTVNGTTIPLGGSDTITAGKVLGVATTLVTGSFSYSIGNGWTHISQFDVNYTAQSTSSTIIASLFIGAIGYWSAGNTQAWRFYRDNTLVNLGTDTSGGSETAHLSDTRYGYVDDNHSATKFYSVNLGNPPDTNQHTYRPHMGAESSSTIYFNRTTNSHAGAFVGCSAQSWFMIQEIEI